MFRQINFFFFWPWCSCTALLSQKLYYIVAATVVKIFHGKKEDFNGICAWKLGASLALIYLCVISNLWAADPPIKIYIHHQKLEPRAGMYCIVCAELLLGKWSWNRAIWFWITEWHDMLLNERATALYQAAGAKAPGSGANANLSAAI